MENKKKHPIPVTCEFDFQKKSLNKSRLNTEARMIAESD